ncbi:MAG: hypothetical protein QFB86_02485, partial [Patescibacteria group bacterium]|nr:hypothetical protein [Patescibacteria group bacterium]
MHEGRRFFLGGEKPYPVEELREQFSRQAELPPGGDPLIGSMFTIFNEQPPDSHIAKTNDMLATLRYENFPRTKPDEFANILRAAYSMYFLRDNKVLGKPNFDYAQVNTKQKLTEHLEHAAKRIFEDNDDDITVSLIQYYVSHAYLQTTVISRYAPGGVLLRTLDERYKGGADWLDDGASIGQGAYQLFNNAEHPLQFDVVSKRGDKKPYEQSDELLKQATNTLLLGSLPVARCVCLDIAQVHHPSKGEHGELDSGAVAWAEASLQPQEHMDTAFMKRFNELQHKASHRIDHKKLDISSKKDYEELL